MLNYFNNAATSFPKPNVIEKSVADFFKNPPVNSSRSCNCIKKENDVDVVCKKKLRDFLNISDDYELILTPGATYSANIAINAISKKLDKPILISNSWCHNCIMRNHFARIGTTPILLDDFKDIHNTIHDNNYYIAITHQNNVDGNIIDDETIIDIISKCSKYNIPVILDITQSIGSHPINISKYNYENLFVFASLHKNMYSVPGIGFLTVPKQYTDYKLIYGGGGGVDSINYKDTKSFEVGTPNELAMASAIAGIDYINKIGMSKISLTKEILCNYFQKLWCSNITCMNNTFKLNKCYPKSGIISLSPLYTQKCYEIVQDLTTKNNIICRYGLHCSPLYHFNILKCNSTLRFSFGHFNTKLEIDYLFEAFSTLF